jgi:cytochrome c-type biogenesis protein
VLAAILVLAGSSDTALEGAALLAVYSLGLAIPFVLAGALVTRAIVA